MIPDHPITGPQEAETVQSLMDQERPEEALGALKGLEPSEQTLWLRLVSLRRLRHWPELADLASGLLKTDPRPSPQLMARAHGLLGLARMRLGTPLAAEKHFRAAIHIATWDINDEAEALYWHRDMAVMYKNLGRWQQAKFENLSAMATADAIACHRESGGLRTNLAIVYLKSGEFGAVETLLNESEAFFVKAGRPPAILNNYLVRGCYLNLMGRPKEALGLLSSTLGELQALDLPRETAICLEYTGDSHLALRDYTSAAALYQRALNSTNASKQFGDVLAETGYRLGEALVNLGDPNGAIISCERGLKVARETGERYEECANQRVLALANWASGNPRKALRTIAEGIDLARSYEIPYELARALQWYGEARLQSATPDDQTQARRHLWEARSIYERLGLTHAARHVDKLLGFESQPEPSTSEPGIEALQGLTNLDGGALRFGIVTCNPEVSEAVATIQSIAPSRIPVLITGQSGVGKEVLAKALHLMSDRRKGPFVPVNCGAVSQTLIDSEFFGHERGAFTGAVSAREGLIASAHQGTLFLDEIGELSPAAQATLLRVLETGELRPVGRDDLRKIDVRLVAATNASLEDLVERGVFRRDLYYRLNGVSVTLPPLQEREEDIRALFRHFWAQAVAMSRKKLVLSDDVEAMLCAYSWPGNVRELKNEVARVVAMADSGTVVSREAFLPKQRARTAESLRRTREQLTRTSAEREEILRALRAHGGNKAEAARSLGGMKRTTLLYKIERLGIRPEEYLVNE
jgi:DNA-binding NtrC family response regulator/tetratricopeptide (TPR) repeat protein